MKHRIRSASLVVRDEKLLLVRHLAGRADADYWIPPGGGMKRSDASVFACAERETLEETGVRVRGSKILYLREFIDHVYEVREMEFFILADTADGEAAVREIPLSGSDLPFVTEVGWFPKEKLQSITVYPECLKTEFWDDRNSSPIPTRHLGTDIRKKREANQPVDSTSASPDVSQIREAMRGKAERDPRRERAGARDQADRSDNTASRACRFKVSAEHYQRDRPYLAEPHSSLLSNQ